MNHGCCPTACDAKASAKTSCLSRLCRTSRIALPIETYLASALSEPSIEDQNRAAAACPTQPDETGTEGATLQCWDIIEQCRRTG
eukprot:2073707-Amphidinium_carterae.2